MQSNEISHCRLLQSARTVGNMSYEHTHCLILLCFKCFCVIEQYMACATELAGLNPEINYQICRKLNRIHRYTEIYGYGSSHRARDIFVWFSPKHPDSASSGQEL